MIKGLSSLKLVVGFGFPYPGDPSCSLLHTTRSEREGVFFLSPNDSPCQCLQIFSHNLSREWFLSPCRSLQILMICCQDSPFLCRSFHTVALLDLRRESTTQTFNQTTPGRPTSGQQTNSNIYPRSFGYRHQIINSIELVDYEVLRFERFL